MIHSDSIYKIRSLTEFLIAFHRWMKSDTGFIEGVVVRNFFEILLGSVTKVDLDFVRLTAVYCDKPENRHLVSSSWSDLVNYLLVIAAVSKVAAVDQPTFGGWRFSGITTTPREPDDSPASELIFTSSARTIVVTFLAWKDRCYNDFDVNCICFTGSGFGLKNHGSVGFGDVLEGIIHREASYVKRADVLQTNAFGTDKVGVKQKNFMAIYELISNKWLKIRQAGYSIVGNQPQMYIETEEECIITGCKPNFPCIKFSCGHDLSLMAYKGIVYNGENPRCPMCRENLTINFTTVEKTRAKVDLPDLPSLAAENFVKRGFSISRDLCSSSALESL